MPDISAEEDKRRKEAALEACSDFHRKIHIFNTLESNAQLAFVTTLQSAPELPLQET